MRDPEVAEVRHELAGSGEAELGRQLQAVGRAQFKQLGTQTRRNTAIERVSTTTSTPETRRSPSNQPVVSTASQRAPKRRAGRRKVMSSKCALNSNRKDSSRTCSP